MVAPRDIRLEEVCVLLYVFGILPLGTAACLHNLEGETVHGKADAFVGATGVTWRVSNRTDKFPSCLQH